MGELTSKTIAELRDGIAGGEFSAREVAEAYNAAVEAGRALNAYTVETPELALAAADEADKARAADALKPLSGVPLGIKDLFATEGVDTTAGSTILSADRAASAPRVIVSWSRPMPEYAGQDLDAIARTMGVDRDEAIRRLSPAGGIYFRLDEADVQRVLQHTR